MSWDEIAVVCGTDKSSEGHGYMAAYERFVTGPIASVLEIGVDRGHSLRAWAQIFPAARVTGIDIRAECAAWITADERIEVLIADATDAAEMDALLEDRSFDLIVDDGSHQLHDVFCAAELLMLRLRPRGVYAIEDMPTGPEGAGALVMGALAGREDCAEAGFVRSLQGWASLCLFRKADA